MSDERWQKVVENFQMMPECGACEDDEHDNCTHPRGSVQVAVDEWKPICCCRDHPLIAVLEEIDDENDHLRAVLSALCDASDDLRIIASPVDRKAFFAARAVAVSVLQGEQGAV